MDLNQHDGPLWPGSTTDLYPSPRYGQAPQPPASRASVNHSDYLSATLLPSSGGYQSAFPATHLPQQSFDPWSPFALRASDNPSTSFHTVRTTSSFTGSEPPDDSICGSAAVTPFRLAGSVSEPSLVGVNIKNDFGISSSNGPERQWAAAYEASSSIKEFIPTAEKHVRSHESCVRRCEEFVRESLGRCRRETSRQNVASGKNGNLRCTFGCGLVSDKKWDWRRHELSNRPQEFWICSACPFASASVSHRKDKFSEHIKTTHREANPHLILGNSKVDYVSTVPLTCGFCGKTFRDFNAWSEDVYAHFKNGEDLSTWMSSTDVAEGLSSFESTKSAEGKDQYHPTLHPEKSNKSSDDPSLLVDVGGAFEGQQPSTMERSRSIQSESEPLQYIPRLVLGGDESDHLVTDCTRSSTGQPPHSPHSSYFLSNDRLAPPLANPKRRGKRRRIGDADDGTGDNGTVNLSSVMTYTRRSRSSPPRAPLLYNFSEMSTISAPADDDRSPTGIPDEQGSSSTQVQTTAPTCVPQTGDLNMMMADPRFSTTTFTSVKKEDLIAWLDEKFIEIQQHNERLQDQNTRLQDKNTQLNNQIRELKHVLGEALNVLCIETPQSPSIPLLRQKVSRALRSTISDSAIGLSESDSRAAFQPTMDSAGFPFNTGQDEFRWNG